MALMLPFRRRSPDTCWKGSTGAIRAGHSGLLRRADWQKIPCFIDIFFGVVVAIPHVGDRPRDRCSARCPWLAAEARASAAEEELTQTRAVVSASADMIRHLRLQIAKLRREQYGHSAERHARLIEQLEMQLEDLETDLSDDRARAEAVTSKTAVVAFERRRPARKPFPEHLPRERVVIEAPAACTCCGSARIVKMGEDVTETLEVIPRQWKVVCYPAGFCLQSPRGHTVREKFTCRGCERISQPPAPFHATPRGWAGPRPSFAPRPAARSQPMR